MFKLLMKMPLQLFLEEKMSWTARLQFIPSEVYSERENHFFSIYSCVICVSIVLARYVCQSVFYVRCRYNVSKCTKITKLWTDPLAVGIFSGKRMEKWQARSVESKLWVERRKWKTHRRHLGLERTVLAEQLQA